MIKKEFKDLSVNDQFTVNNIKYIKISEVKVSCCRSVNCHVSGKQTERTFFAPSTIVEIEGNA